MTTRMPYEATPAEQRVPVPYREMRQILGLPEPTDADRLRAAARTWAGFFDYVAVSFTVLVEALQPIGEHLADVAEQLITDTTQPPMWTTNPTRSRRPR